jgi:hypothetical protein
LGRVGIQHDCGSGLSTAFARHVRLHLDYVSWTILPLLLLTLASLEFVVRAVANLATHTIKRYRGTLSGAFVTLVALRLTTFCGNIAIHYTVRLGYWYFYRDSTRAVGTALATFLLARQNLLIPWAPIVGGLVTCCLEKIVTTLDPYSWIGTVPPSPDVSEAFVNATHALGLHSHIISGALCLFAGGKLSSKVLR